MPRWGCGLRGGAERAQCLAMSRFIDLSSVPSGRLVPFTDQLRLAVAAYLARFKGASRTYTESDLRCYLAWCAEHGLDPLTARRPHLELEQHLSGQLCGRRREHHHRAEFGWQRDGVLAESGPRRLVLVPLAGRHLRPGHLEHE